MKLTCSQQNLCIFHFKEEHTPSSPSGLTRMYAGTLRKKSIYQKSRWSWAWASVLINSQSLQRHVRCSEQKWRQRWFKPPGCAMFWRNTQTLGGSCHPGSAILREQWTHCVRRPASVQESTETRVCPRVQTPSLCKARARSRSRNMTDNNVFKVDTKYLHAAR